MNRETDTMPPTSSRTPECLTLAELYEAIDIRSAIYQEKRAHLESCAYCRRGLRTCFRLTVENLKLEDEDEPSLSDWEPAEIVTDRDSPGAQFFILEKIGFGAYKDAYLAEGRDRQGNEELCVLRRLRKVDDAAHNALVKEIKFHVDAGSHPNLVPFVGAFITQRENILVIVTRYASALTLKNWIGGASAGKADWYYACEIVQDLLSGLEHIHSRGIFHLDIKPENIVFQDRPLLSASGVDTSESDVASACLIDYGLARYRNEETDEIAGSLAYMPTEALQAIADKTQKTKGIYTAQWDIYSIGVVLYEMLAGRLPFEFRDLASLEERVQRNALIRQIIESKPVPLPASIPAEIAAIVMKALAPKASERFVSASVMKRELYEAMLRAAVRNAKASFPDRDMMLDSYYVLNALDNCHRLMPEHELHEPFLAAPPGGLPGGPDAAAREQGVQGNSGTGEAKSTLVGKREVLRQDRRLAGLFLTEVLTGEPVSPAAVTAASGPASLVRPIVVRRPLPDSVSREIAGWIEALLSGDAFRRMAQPLASQFLKVAQIIGGEANVLPGAASVALIRRVIARRQQSATTREPAKPAMPDKPVRSNRRKWHGQTPVTNPTASAEPYRWRRLIARNKRKREGRSPRKGAKPAVGQSYGLSALLGSLACLALLLALGINWLHRLAPRWRPGIIPARTPATADFTISEQAVTMPYQKASDSDSAYYPARLIVRQAGQEYASDVTRANQLLESSLTIARKTLAGKERDRYFWYTAMDWMHHNPQAVAPLISEIKNVTLRHHAEYQFQMTFRLKLEGQGSRRDQLFYADRFAESIFSEDPEECRRLVEQVVSKAISPATALTPDERDYFLLSAACKRLTQDVQDAEKIAKHIRSEKVRNKFVDARRRVVKG